MKIELTLGIIGVSQAILMIAFGASFYLRRSQKELNKARSKFLFSKARKIKIETDLICDRLKNDNHDCKNLAAEIMNLVKKQSQAVYDNSIVLNLLSEKISNLENERFYIKRILKMIIK